MVLPIEMLHRHDANVVRALKASSTVTSLSHAVAGTLWSVGSENWRQSGNEGKVRQVTVDVCVARFAFAVVTQGGRLDAELEHSNSAAHDSFLARVGAVAREMSVSTRGSHR